MLIDLVMLALLLGIPLSSYLAPGFMLSLVAKILAACWGAKIGLTHRAAR